MSGIKQGSVAKRYASALVRVAQEEGRLEEVYQELLRIEGQLAQNYTLRLVMNSPVVKPTQKKSILQAMAGSLALSSSVVNLLQLMVDNDRIEVLPLLVLLFRDHADACLGRVRVQVTSAAPLGEHEARLKSVLEKNLNKKIIMESSVDPQILGGLVVRVKDMVFDASIQRELLRLRESIVEQVVA